MESGISISFINSKCLGKITITGIKATSIHLIPINTNVIFEGNS